MPGLTAKVFRTYNASYTMSKLLQELPTDRKKTVAEYLKLYNDCNREVAILCNHKRTVGAAHESQMEKLEDRIKGLRYQKWRTKMMMLDVDPKLKKKKEAKEPGYFDLDEDLDETWVHEHQAFLVEQERTKITKKFEKENEKREAEGEKPLPEKELKDRLKVANELEAKFKKENKSKKVEAEGKGPTVAKFEAAVKKLEERIETFKLQAQDREGNKEVALGTSKIVSHLHVPYTSCVDTNFNRTTSILVSRSSSAPSSRCQSRSSSPRRCATSSSGPSSRLETTTLGSFEFSQGLDFIYPPINTNVGVVFCKMFGNPPSIHFAAWGISALYRHRGSIGGVFLEALTHQGMVILEASREASACIFLST